MSDPFEQHAAGGSQEQHSLRPAAPLGRAEVMIRRGLDALAIFSVLTIGMAGALTCVDVVLRNLGIASVRGVIDLTQLAMMYSVFAAIAYGFGTRSHVAVTVLTDAFPASWSRALACFGWAAGVVLLALLGYAVFGQARLVISYGDMSQNLRIPMGVYWVPVVAGLFLSSIAALWAIREEIRQG